jgi:hypothetical protein
MSTLRVGPHEELLRLTRQICAALRLCEAGLLEGLGFCCERSR